MRVLKRFWGWITWQRVPVAEVKIVRPGKELVIVLAYAAFYIAGAAIVSQIILLKPLPILGSVDFTTDIWYALVFKLGFLLLLPVIWFLRQGYHLRDLFPKWRLQFKTAVSILIAFVIGLCVNIGSLDFVSRAATGFSTGELIVRVGIGVILPLLIAALPEELVYRGFLQTRAERIFGRIPAILLTALLFAAWHLPSRFFLAHGVEGQAGNIASVLEGTGLPVFVAGLLFGLFWDRYRSLPPLIAAHWGIDIIPIVASFLGVRY